MATGKYDQAPKLINKGKPESNGNFILINMELFKNINQKIDTKHGLARSLLILLIGTADGFGLSEKFMTDNLVCTKQGYLKARKYLNDIGMIIDDQEKRTITIDYNAILGITEITPKEETSITEFTSKSISQFTTMGITEITYNKEETENKTKNIGISSIEEIPAAPNTVGLAVKSVNYYDLLNMPGDSFYWIDNDHVQSKRTNAIFKVYGRMPS